MVLKTSFLIELSGELAAMGTSPSSRRVMFLFEMISRSSSLCLVRVIEILCSRVCGIAMCMMMMVMMKNYHQKVGSTRVYQDCRSSILLLRDNS